MRLAVISDIHGNLRALETVHREIRAAAPDLIVNLGDCLSGPLWPEETAQYLAAQGWPTVRGNHDRELAETPAAELGESDAFTHQELSRVSREWVAALPATMSLEPDVFLCHGSPSSDEIFLLEEDGGNHFFPSTESAVRHKLSNVTAELVLCGHSHTPRVVQVSERQIVLNPGSVGVQAFPGLTVTGSPHARFAIATRQSGRWSFDLRAIHYDWAEAASRAEAGGFANWAHGLSTGFAADAVGT
ncbi:MAG TPA: metallophosphoesterase family protein [Mesorhizobium sp.]|jgi:predicted phosphodiesterase|uniref:metallophosphoesterase family protein n=1 Tax=Mesorhizobium sp. TaxID=1871066 RepID=UPI002DDD61D1|nr:metallophosphoesterase family protein [Mesorhizobium sp.]HEV2503489.1 metallophosphoesterase family protein [Mesorhizobium sp.]